MTDESTQSTSQQSVQQSRSSQPTRSMYKQTQSHENIPQPTQSPNFSENYDHIYNEETRLNEEKFFAEIEYMNRENGIFMDEFPEMTKDYFDYLLLEKNAKKFYDASTSWTPWADPSVRKRFFAVFDKFGIPLKTF
jgi:hypothetical protein